MVEHRPSQHELDGQLITPAKAREALTAADPDYGKDFSEKEWEEIAERLSALARLLWAFSQRQVREGHEPQKEPADR